MLRMAGRLLRRRAPLALSEEGQLLRRHASRPRPPMDNPRRLFSSGCAGSAQSSKQRPHSNLSESEQRRIIKQEELAFRRRWSSDEERLTRLAKGINGEQLLLLLKNSDQFDQIKPLLFVVVIPASVFVGIVLHRMHMLG